ncbi:mannose-1-phosphate guanylyltransferase/mannose-6-phosphate isomerase [Moraxellaceae bacterium AER2_44_116]|nr:mannose-1-phosphate guanylyltransferase/mannose-6-phosphate isomerase [Moraxellaceae bacterium]TQC98949.1 mannose-1-phosphate guanylyltransferase/mannose-6-phosphate isomerase [Moraxellaceae bacterium AER2_44_116]
MIPVILSGGSGTRLWPLSRQQCPKQFLPLVDPQFTLFQSTLKRLEGLNAESPIIVCNVEHRFMVAEQLRDIEVAHQGILLEPCGRNTAAAVALAALRATATGCDPILLILPADHVITHADAFLAATKSALLAAEAGYLVTFGIVPKAPETGYGYIRCGVEIEQTEALAVTAFVEKPDTTTAQSYLDSGEYLWNSGMFVFRASVFLQELEHFRPDILSACKVALAASTEDADFVRLDKNSFTMCPEDSVDYAVMEKTDKAVVIALDAGWNDVGAWSAVWEVSEKDVEGNALHGNVVSVNSNNNFVHCEQHLVALIGVTDLIVVTTKDATLVADRNQVQSVKTVVEKLRAMGCSEAIIHREVSRPWGKYDSIDRGGRFQVKRITVNPGQRLSLQMHHHRAEHWIVVRGTAEVVCGEKRILLTENQSTYIPLGERHQLINPGKVLLEIIEVQSGSYLGEDDIVRYEDTYGRL